MAFAFRHQTSSMDCDFGAKISGACSYSAFFQGIFQAREIFLSGSHVMVHVCLCMSREHLLSQALPSMQLASLRDGVVEFRNVTGSVALALQIHGCGLYIVFSVCPTIASTKVLFLPL